MTRNEQSEMETRVREELDALLDSIALTDPERAEISELMRRYGAACVIGYADTQLSAVLRQYVDPAEPVATSS